MSVYKVYVENSCIRFVPEGHAGDGEPSLAVAPGESVSMTKLLQKLQFTKKLTVISEKIESVFGEFRASMPLIEAGGGLVSDAGGRVLMIFRNGRWDLPKGKLEPGERIEECAVREVSEEVRAAVAGTAAGRQDRRYLSLLPHRRPLGAQADELVPDALCGSRRSPAADRRGDYAGRMGRARADSRPLVRGLLHNPGRVPRGGTLRLIQPNI